MTKHQYKKRDDGLHICLVCNGAEGQLTTECCNKRLSQKLLDAVYNGHVDFNYERWHLYGELSEDILMEIYIIM